MPGRLSRRDNILKAAGDLFLKQGYQATTVRQIAEAVGCTEAALYYHFKGGKRELLQRVIEDVELDLRSAVQALEQAASLSDLVRRYGSAVADMRGGQIQRTIRWISYEMPSLTPEERRPFYEALLTFQRALTGAVGCFIGDPEEAEPDRVAAAVYELWLSADFLRLGLGVAGSGRCHPPVRPALERLRTGTGSRKLVCI